MKERPLFFQDFGFLESIPKEQRLLGYKQALEASKSLIQGGLFSFLDQEYWAQRTQKLKLYVDHLQTFEKILILGPKHIVRNIKALCAPFQSWVWIEDSFPRLCFLDQLDAETFWELMSINRPQKTAVLVVCEKENDIDILLPLMRCLEYWKGLIPDDHFGRHFFVMHRHSQDMLSQMIEQFQLTRLEEMEDWMPICFSSAAILPAMVLGFKPDMFFEGIFKTGQQFFTGLLKSPVEMAGMIWSFLKTGDIRHHLFFAFGDFFRPLIDWYQTSWNQFFGKHACHFSVLSAHGFESVLDLDDKVTLGQNQFWTLFLEMQNPYEGFKPEIWEHLPEVQKLCSLSMPHLLKNHFEEMTRTLTLQKKPFRTLKVHVLNEKTLGALMMNSLLEMSLVLSLMSYALKKN